MDWLNWFYKDPSASLIAWWIGPSSSLGPSILKSQRGWCSQLSLQYHVVPTCCDFVLATGPMAIATSKKLCFSGMTGVLAPGMTVMVLWKLCPVPRWVWEGLEPESHSLHGGYKAWPQACLTFLPLTQFPYIFFFKVKIDYLTFWRSNAFLSFKNFKNYAVVET